MGRTTDDEKYDAVAWEAWEHLAHRRWPPGSGRYENLSTLLGAVIRVWGADDRAAEHPDGDPASVADSRDILAALTVLHRQVRQGVDQLEAELLERARSRGVSWEEIATALGFADRAGAYNHHRRLTARTPDNIL